MTPAAIGHKIASDAGNAIVRQGFDANLSWEQIALVCESTIAIVVIACATMSKTPDQARFSAEIIDTMTQHAHRRVTALITGEPYEG